MIRLTPMARRAIRLSAQRGPTDGGWVTTLVTIATSCPVQHHTHGRWRAHCGYVTA